MSLDYVPGTVCAYGDRVVQIDGMDSLAHAMVRDMANGRLFRVEVAKLRELPSASKQQEIGYVPEAEWNRSIALSRALLALPPEGRVARENLEPIARKFGVTIRQIQRARKKLREEARASALLRSPGGRPKGLSRLSETVHEVINHVILKHYFRRERPCKAEISERARSMCRRLGLPPPSKNAVLRRISNHLGYEADIKRLGRKVANQIWKPRPGKLGALAPLDLVQIDHTRVDVMVVSDDRQSVLGRPWITLAIDVCTRVVLGMYLSMDPPSSVSVSLCIEHCVLPKPEDAQDPGLWPVHGKPGCIHVDNGKDLRAEALKRGCGEHGIDLQWRPVRTPHYGAHIERLNGTLMRLCHLLPGTTFSNPREKGDYDSEARATMTLSELKDWLVQKIGRFYHVRRHKALGLPPIVAWQQAHTNDQGELVPPPLVADPASFRIDFLPFEFRCVNRTGIELHSSRYWHPDLAPLLNAPELTMVRYDPRSPQAVWVRMPDGQLVEAPAIAGRALGCPARRAQLDAETAAAMDAAIDAHYERCDEIEEQAARKTRAARRKKGKPRTSSSPAKGADPLPATAPSAPPTNGSGVEVTRESLPECSPGSAPEAPPSRPEPSPAPPPLKSPARSPLPAEDWS